MPSTWRAHVITEHLQASGIVATVVERDIYALTGDERHAVLDAMIRNGAEAPMVVVDGRVVCTGGVDLEAVLEATRQAG
jgi:hypothetical protein